MSSGIPVIDFGQFLVGSDEDRLRIATEFDNALRSVGFIYLCSHGIDQTKIDTCFEWTKSRRFFDLSVREKEMLRPAPHSFNQGYFGIDQEKIRGQKCSKENFNFGSLGEAQGSWPREENLPGFREFATDFHKDCSRLTDKLIECLSMALGLDPDDSLGQYHTDSTSVSSFIHYPAISAQDLRPGKVVRNPAHSDFGTLTILFQRDVGGLQIADMGSTTETTSVGVERSAQFISVDPKPGAVVINTGYLLMRWTNGRWKNTVHRVLEPQFLINEKPAQDREVMISERYSVAFFSFPDMTTIIEPLSTCFSNDASKRWKPVNAGEYLLRKRAAMYS